MTTPVQAGQSITANLLNSISARVIAGAAVGFSNSNAETVVGTVTIPATDPLLNVQFSGYELRFTCVCSTTGTPTVTVRVRLGSLAGTVLFNSGAISTPSASNAPAYLSEKFFITATGAGGTADFFAELDQTFAGASVFIAGTPGVTVNTTASLTLVVTAQFSAAAAGNVFTGDAIAMCRF